MMFAPQEPRSAQVSSAEELLHLLDAAKAYPVDFVVFKITGYHPMQVGSDLLTGLALQHDLGLLIEQVSDSLDLQTAALTEPVLSIDDVTERFDVTSKTIQRWRRKGLPARRFVFPDGKRRVGFLLSSVERFFSLHRDQVARGTNFTLVDDSERDEIIRRARRLATACHCCVGEITRRIGHKMDRSPLTVLHTIRKYDQEHPDSAIFSQAPDPIGEEDRATAVKAVRRGVPLATVARRLCRPRTMVYRVLLEERVARLQRRKVRFIDDSLFHGQGAAAAIDAIAASGELSRDSKRDAKRDEARVPRDLPAYLQELYRTPLLTPAGERALFLKFNYQKYRFAAARRKLDPSNARRRDLEQMETLLREATETKNNIVRANLRLVVSVARKHLRGPLSLMELVSDGNLTLMRAVEGFDVQRGHRFSTYATLALMKGFARSVPLLLSSRRGGGADVNALADLPDRRIDTAADHMLDREELRHLLSTLDDRERSVLLAYYGLGESRAPETYAQVGQRFGLSKGRVRQIERAAIEKLRVAANVAE